MRLTSAMSISGVTIAPLTPSSPESDGTANRPLGDLKNRSVRGAAVTMSAQAIKFLLQMTSTAVLARLLTPADFGLVAMVAAFTGFVGLFKDLGLSMATVQRVEITSEQVSTLFWANVVVSIILAAVGMALAPAVTWFYGEPRLGLVTIAISATFIFGGLAAQHTALLQRRLRFASLALIDVVSMLCGVGIGVLLALLGAKYWALIAMTAAQSFLAALGAWIASGWRPGMARRGSGILPMLKFGGNLTGFNSLNYFTRNLDNILIGSVLGSMQLGIYSKAYNLLTVPISQINAPLAAVAMPTLCRLQHNPAQFRRYYLRAVEMIAFFGMPLVAYAFVHANDLIRVLLGAQWMGAVPVFRWLAPAAFIGTLNVAPGWLCGSLGRTNRQFRWAILSTPVMVAAFVVGLRWGAVGVAAAFSISWCGLFFALLAYSCKGSPVRLRDIMVRVWRPALAAIGAAATTTILSPLAASCGNAAVRASIGMCFYAFSFLGICMFLPNGRRALNDLVSIVARHRSKKT